MIGDKQAMISDKKELATQKIGDKKAMLEDKKTMATEKKALAA